MAALRALVVALMELVPLVLVLLALWLLGLSELEAAGSHLMETTVVVVSMKVVQG